MIPRSCIAFAFTLLTAFSAPGAVLEAAEGSLDWAKRAGGVGWDGGISLASCIDGSSVMSGGFDETATFGAGEANETTLGWPGCSGGFIARYNTDGTLAWAKGPIGDYDFEDSGAIASGADGSILVTGYFTDTAIFGVGESNETHLESAGSSDIFIARYDEDGTLAWAKRAGSTKGDQGMSIACFPDGSSAITGWFEETAVFGAGEAMETTLSLSGPWWGVFIARYNADGTLAWAKGGNRGEGGGLSSDEDGSSVVSGRFGGTSVFGAGEENETSLVAAGYNDIFIARYSTDGTLAWAKSAGGAHPDHSYAVALFGDGSSVATGSFEISAIFGEGEANETTLTAVGSVDIFVAKYNADGTLAWAKHAGSNYVDWGFDIASLESGSSFVTGFFTQTATFGIGERNQTILVSAGGYDAYIAKYNAKGTLAWAKRIANKGPSFGLGIASYIDGSCVVSGDFGGTAVFGEGEANETDLVSAGNQDLFIARYHGLSTSPTLAPTPSSSPSPTPEGYRTPTPSPSRTPISTPTPFGYKTPTPIPTPSASPSPCCLATPVYLVLASGDYDGDGTSDVALFQSGSGLWAVRDITRTHFGTNGDWPVSGDYDGDGTTDIGVFRRDSGLWAVQDISRAYFGSSLDRPVPADYDGDRMCDAGVFRDNSGMWAIREITRICFGTQWDLPAPGDFNGDGTGDIAVVRGDYRPGFWAIRGISRFSFWQGGYGYIPQPGDYDGDGRDEAAVYGQIEGLWMVRDITYSFWGRCCDSSPSGADYNGDGLRDIGIFNEAGRWAVSGITRCWLGSTGDIPVTR